MKPDYNSFILVHVKAYQSKKISCLNFCDEAC